MNIIPISQRDDRWARVTLGNNIPHSQYNIGGWGCYITSMAMAAGCTPTEMNRALKAVGGFAPSDGNLINAGIWEKATRIFDHPFKFVKQTFPAHINDAYPEVDRQEILAAKPNTVFLLVDNILGYPLNEHHVLVTEIVNSSILVADPWIGDIVPLCPRFGRTETVALIQATFIEYL